MTIVTRIADLLQQRPPRLVTLTEKRPAAVAMVLAGDPGQPQLLFIERARHPQDPWSGNLAFPGGRVDPQDRDQRAAAERETREELGFDLTDERCLGRLDDIAGAYLPVRIACFVYHLAEFPRLQANHEVRSSFWFDFLSLTDLQRHQLTPLQWQGQERRVHAIDLLGPGRPVLWGITYRLVVQLLTRLEMLEPQLVRVADD